MQRPASHSLQLRRERVDVVKSRCLSSHYIDTRSNDGTNVIMSHHIKKQFSSEEYDGVSSNSYPFISQNDHGTYSSSNYYTDRQNLPIQRLAIETYLSLKKWIFSQGWFGLLSITVICMLLVHWSLKEKMRQRQKERQHHDVRPNPVFSFIRSFFPSPVMEFLDSVVSLWIHLSVVAGSVMKLRLQIKTKSRQGRESRHSVQEQTALQERVAPAYLPELEDAVESVNGISTQSSAMRPLDSDESTHSLVELEPAFLNPTMYPTGWLTYHPVFGLMDIKDFHQVKDNPPRTTSRAVAIDDTR